MEPIYFGRRPGVVLHQPLNCADFRKNDENGQNMNGIPVSPERKMENAPTWRPPNPVFGTPFWGCFSANLLPSSPINHVLSLLFLFLPTIKSHTTYYFYYPPNVYPGTNYQHQVRNSPSYLISIHLNNNMAKM